jgi:hypothetical protein
VYINGDIDATITIIVQDGSSNEQHDTSFNVPRVEVALWVPLASSWQAPNKWKRLTSMNIYRTAYAKLGTNHENALKASRVEAAVEIASKALHMHIMTNQPIVRVVFNDRHLADTDWLLDSIQDCIVLKELVPKRSVLVHK